MLVGGTCMDRTGATTMTACLRQLPSKQQVCHHAGFAGMGEQCVRVCVRKTKFQNSCAVACILYPVVVQFCLESSATDVLVQLLLINLLCHQVELQHC